MTGAFGRPDPTKCKSGLHDWTPANIYTAPNGKRNSCCRICVQERGKEWRAANRVPTRVKGMNPRTSQLVAHYHYLVERGETADIIMLETGRTAQALVRMLKRHGQPVTDGLREAYNREYRQSEAARKAAHTAGA